MISHRPARRTSWTIIPPRRSQGRGRFESVNGIFTRYMPTDYWLENVEAENGDAVIHVASESSGTGTRQAAEKLRTLALNTVLADKKRVIFDFSGVNLVSSSYADELVGKTIGKYGFSFFLDHFAIKNLSATNTMILNRSVQQRMAQAYYNEAIPEGNAEDV